MAAQIHGEGKTAFYTVLTCAAVGKERAGSDDKRTKTGIRGNYRGYLNLERDWAEDEITVYFPAGLVLENLPDAPELAAVLEGPIVLAS